MKASKRLLTLLLSCTLAISMVPSAFAVSMHKDNTWNDCFTDSQGNSIELVFSNAPSNGADTQVTLYVNDVLNQESYVYSDENKVLTYLYSETTDEQPMSIMHAPICQEYTLSDIMQTLVPDEGNFSEESMGDEPLMYRVNVPFPVFNSEGWAYVDHLPASSVASQPYSIDLYRRNYDEEPDQNRFEKANVNFAANTPVSTIASALFNFINYITEKISVKDIIKTFAVDIILNKGDEVIAQDMKGLTCYSTQKILYAPVVEGYNIYPSAYMTRLYLVSVRAVDEKTQIKLISNNYKI